MDLYAALAAARERLRSDPTFAAAANAMARELRDLELDHEPIPDEEVAGIVIMLEEKFLRDIERLGERLTAKIGTIVKKIEES